MQTSCMMSPKCKKSCPDTRAARHRVVTAGHRCCGATGSGDSMKKLAFVGAVCAAALALAACAPASSSAPETVEYPTAGKTIQLIVPFTAGGTTDVTARAFATVLSDELGGNVEVINTPGAGGQIGLTALAAAAPDGYTLGFTNLPSTI